MHRHRRLAATALALLCAFTIAAGLTVVRLLPARLALWQPSRVAARQLAESPQVLGTAAQAGAAVTAAGLARALAPVVGSAVFGPHLGVLVTSLASGHVLYSVNASAGFAPASTTKLATAAAAVHVLGPAARFRTAVVTGSSPSAIVLVGGGDPTLAAGRPPPADYPQPATLLELAKRTARALRAQGRRTVRLGYDTSLYTGPGTAVGWSPSYISTGNVSVITSLEVDQGKLTAAGAPQDADIPDGLPRAADPAGQAAAVFARYLTADGVAVQGSPAPVRAAPRARTLAAVYSPPLAQIVQWMLEESNNVIAENLARHVAIATGQPASFTGGAAATQAALAKLGVRGIQLFDGSGLSVDDRIDPAALVRLVTLAAGRPQLRSVLTGLPVANFSGTLLPGGSVFGPGGAAAWGVVRAKTGNLNTVAALSGIAYARNGQLLAFAIMADKLHSGELVPAASGMASMATVLASCGCH
ncbi:MAG TPA: D-alanyl-D-alanine carboxypeptidase/D-alanyl-D-alanine-endopeptidase [Streptosporangiaceae bacterium]